MEFVRADIASLDDLIDQRNYEQARELLEKLEPVVAAIAGLADRRNTLNGPTGRLAGAVAAIESAALTGEDPPGFLSDLRKAFEAHPKVRRLEELLEHRSTRDLSTEVRDLRNRVLDDARRLLGLRIQDRIVRGFRSPQFLTSLEIFRKAIRAAAKRADAIEALKSSEEFNASILTDVFPCWVMRPEEACRVFPLEADLFDVVIFDEASQCNPDQALPLLARARRTAIFGDEKQLSNEDLRRSLSVPNNRSLLRQAGLEELDRGGLFDQTKNSLLDLVSTRTQATIVLNEHFRCRPELIAFSTSSSTAAACGSCEITRTTEG